jgi:hypothetical protein
MTGKRLVIFSAVFALAGTVLIVGNLRGKEAEENGEDEYKEFFEKALEGKKAISISIPASEIPDELIYPGSRVDVLEKGKSKESGIVENAFVLTMNIIDENTVKITLALSDEQGRRINTFQPNQLTVMVRGKGVKKTKDNKDEDIEIIEL